MSWSGWKWKKSLRGVRTRLLVGSLRTTQALSLRRDEMVFFFQKIIWECGMNETQEKLMEVYGVLVLPDEINHAAYELVVESLHFARHCGHDRVVMYCAGFGGEMPSALAIVDLVRAHGNVVGLLPGQANSSHATIWLGCAERYVYPMGEMGIHEVRYDVADNTKLDARHARNFEGEMKSYNERLATLLSEACDEHDVYSVGHWRTVLHQVGASGYHHYDAEYLIMCGIAKPIEALDGVLLGGQGNPYARDDAVVNTDISHLSEEDQARFRRGGVGIYYDADGQVQIVYLPDDLMKYQPKFGEDSGFKLILTGTDGIEYELNDDGSGRWMVGDRVDEHHNNRTHKVAPVDDGLGDPAGWDLSHLTSADADTVLAGGFIYSRDGKVYPAVVRTHDDLALVIRWIPPRVDGEVYGGEPVGDELPYAVGDRVQVMTYAPPQLGVVRAVKYKDHMLKSELGHWAYDVELDSGDMVQVEADDLRFVGDSDADVMRAEVGYTPRVGDVVKITFGADAGQIGTILALKSPIWAVVDMNGSRVEINVKYLVAIDINSGQPI